MCIKHTATSSPATASSAPGSRNARTSFTMAAPAFAAATITSRLARVDRDRDVDQLGEQLDDRQHAAQFLVEADRHGAGPGRLAADVQQVGAFGDHPEPMVDRGRDV